LKLENIAKKKAKHPGARGKTGEKTLSILP